MSPPRGSCRRHFPDEGIGLFKCIDEPDSHIRASFVRVVLDREVDIRIRARAV